MATTPQITSKIYQPKIIDLIERAYRLLGKSEQVLPGEAIRMAKSSINLMMGEWMTDFTPQWLIEEARYLIPAESVNPIIALEDGVDNVFHDSPILVRGDQTGEDAEENPRVENYLESINSSEYNEYKTYNSNNRIYYYWFDRDIEPVMKLIGTANEDMTILLIQTKRPDVVMDPLKEAAQIPMRWQDAFVYNLAVKLAPQVIGGNELLPILMPQAADSYAKAWESEDNQEDIEFVTSVFRGMRGSKRRV